MNSTPTAQVGANVKAEMARRGVSQTAMASNLGIGQSALSKRLAGIVPLDINELVTIASALDIPLSILLPAESGCAA